MSPRRGHSSKDLKEVEVNYECFSSRRNSTFKGPEAKVIEDMGCKKSSVATS